MADNVYASPAPEGPPVAGDPDQLEALARRCHRAAAALRADLTSVRGATRVQGWSGEASQAFAELVAGLPRDLGRAADSYDTVGRALTVFASELRAAQREGRRAQAEFDLLDSELTCTLPRLATPATTAAEATAQARVFALIDARSEAARRVARARSAAEVAASEAACRVRAASDAPYDRPGWLVRMVDDVGDWVEENAVTLTKVADGLGALSAALAMLSLIPALSPIVGPLAVALAVGALAINALLAARGKASWIGVAEDTVGLVPAGRTVKAPARVAAGAAPASWRERARAGRNPILEQESRPDRLRRRSHELRSQVCD